MPKVCPRCGHATNRRTGPCKVCKAKIDARHNAQSNERYNDPLYRKNRPLALQRDGHRCKYPGCRRPARDVHHRVPIEDGGTHALENLISGCSEHHALWERQARNARKRRRRGGTIATT